MSALLAARITLKEAKEIRPSRVRLPWGRVGEDCITEEQNRGRRFQILKITRRSVSMHSRAKNIAETMLNRMQRLKPGEFVPSLPPD